MLFVAECREDVLPPNRAFTSGLPSRSDRNYRNDGLLARLQVILELLLRIRGKRVPSRV